MDGRAFLGVARDLAGWATEEHRRAAVGRAYYALVLECRDALHRWQVSLSRRDVHQAVRLKFLYAQHPDSQYIGQALDRLGQWRSQADYQLTFTIPYATGQRALEAIQRAEQAIALLDQIQADPARRAALIAALPP
jgi:hypothetical protein